MTISEFKLQQCGCTTHCWGCTVVYSNDVTLGLGTGLSVLKLSFLYYERFCSGYCSSATPVFFENMLVDIG